MGILLEPSLSNPVCQPLTPAADRCGRSADGESEKLGVALVKFRWNSGRIAPKSVENSDEILANVCNISQESADGESKFAFMYWMIPTCRRWNKHPKHYSGYSQKNIDSELRYLPPATAHRSYCHHSITINIPIITSITSITSIAMITIITIISLLLLLLWLLLLFLLLLLSLLLLLLWLRLLLLLSPWTAPPSDLASWPRAALKPRRSRSPPRACCYLCLRCCLTIWF